MNQEQFLMLIDEHQRIIYKVCRLYRDGREDREDLFQEIVYQLWKGVATFRGEAKISTWLYRVAINTALVAFRRKTIQIHADAAIPDRVDEGPDPEVESRKEHLFFALRQLEESERAIVMLYLDDLSYREIGEITGLTENYVGVKINRIKNKLKHIMNPQPHGC